MTPFYPSCCITPRPTLGEEPMDMTEEEKFVFDLQGYLVMKNVLTDAMILYFA